MLKLVTIALTAFLIVSCKEKAPKVAEVSEDINYDSLNQFAVKDLSAKYHAYSSWQDSSLFSYRLNSLQGQVISFTGRVFDISNQNGKYLLEISGSKKGSYEAELSIDSSLANTIDSLKDKRITKGYFIFKVDKVQPIIAQEIVAKSNESEDDVDIKFDVGRLTRLKGELIDYYFYKR